MSPSQVGEPHEPLTTTNSTTMLREPHEPPALLPSLRNGEPHVPPPPTSGEPHVPPTQS